jgi:AcrR family transcriptional regulator
MSRSPRHAARQTDDTLRRATTRRSSRGEATRERILEAAARAFDRRGYLGVNLNDVVQELGLTKGALYHFFPTKELLAAEIVRRHFAAWERLAGRVVGEHDNLVDALIEMSYRVGRGYQTDSFTRAATRLSNERNLIRIELPEPFVGWIERVTQLLDTAKTRGQVDTGLDSAASAQLMVSFFYGAQTVSQQLTDRQDLLARLDKFWELMEPSLRPSSPGVMVHHAP